MCGFLFSLSVDETWFAPTELTNLLTSRGPDSSTNTHWTVPLKVEAATDRRILHASISATVLSLRGDSIVVQPLIDDETGSIFCWNGEAWTFNQKNINGNDAEAIFQAILTQLFSNSQENPALAVKSVLSHVQGPFSFFLYDAKHKRIFYGRDALGRRSLLVHIEAGVFAVSSVANGSSVGSWAEISAGHISDIDLLDLGRKLVSLENDGLSDSGGATDLNCVFGMPAKEPIQVAPKINKAQMALNSDGFEANIPVALAGLQRVLREALSLRTTNLRSNNNKGGSRLAILFSGGLDCTLIARLCHDVLPYGEDIDLLNVAFENPRVIAAAASREKDLDRHHCNAYSYCPDRLTAITSHTELMLVCPGRHWRLVCIDVPYVDMLAQREQVKSLMYPHDTEMDLSISLALYFASRGRGTCIQPDGGETYTTPASVLLSGLGADELFAGYTRHANAFARGGQEGLIGELELDFSRIGQRNLGRDDRVISHWGKEVRYPFLDENVVTFALERPSWEKFGFMYDKSRGHHDLHNKDKLLLRILAKELGLTTAADQKKRAIQFGARTAKMIDSKARGTQTAV